MGGVFSKPKSPAMPAVAAPPALPDEAPEAEDEAARRMRRRKGYQSTLLAGSLTPDTGKKTLLG